MYLELLEHGIKDGIINLYLPTGKHYQFGRQGTEANWIVRSEDAIKRIARDWEYNLGETYMNGDWDVAGCQLRDLLGVLRGNFKEIGQSRWLMPVLRTLQQWNRITRSYRNVSRHYDLDEGLFRLFLDKEMNYSCAYFTHEDASLEEAQRAKSLHIGRKLLLQPGQRVLDIGCGWGSLALFLARRFEVETLGITLSRRQLAAARRRAGEQGMEDRVHFELADYREHQGHYDRIVSIGMFEHVGRPYYTTYFRRVRQLLKEDGVALIHTIGHSGPPDNTNPWIRAHIFPGGSIPALSEICRAAEQAHCMITDIEVLRLHYMRTLHCWYERFQQHREEIQAMMGERFCRMWEFYLAICEVAFQYSDLVVFQLQLALRHGVVPITRDYLCQDD